MKTQLPHSVNRRCDLSWYNLRQGQAVIDIAISDIPAISCAFLWPHLLQKIGSANPAPVNVSSTPIKL